MSNSSMRSRFRRKTNSLRQSANKRGLKYSLVMKDIIEIYCQFPACPACGLDFKKDYKHPQYATVDRIDPRFGYVVGNVQLLCSSCNNLKERIVKRYLPLKEWHEAAKGLSLFPLLVEGLDLYYKT